MLYNQYKYSTVQYITHREIRWHTFFIIQYHRRPRTTARRVSSLRLDVRNRVRHRRRERDVSRVPIPRVHVRGEPVRVPPLRVRAALSQRDRGLDVPAHRRVRQRRRPIPAAVLVHVGAATQQKLQRAKGRSIRAMISGWS